MFRRYDACLRILALSLVLVCMSGNGASAGEKSQKPLVVNGYVIDVTGMEPALPEILEPRKEKEGRIWIVQFDGPVRAADRERVSGAGCRLLDYLPDFAFLAAMDGDTKKKVEKLPFINGVVRFKPAYKLQVKMRELAVAAGGAEQVRLHLKLDDTADAKDVISRIQQLNGTVLGVGRDSVQAAVGAKAIAELAAMEEVTWINEVFDMQLLNDTSQWVIQTGLPDNRKLWDNGLNGEGEIIGMGDTGLDHDMPWFRDPAGVPIGPGHRKIAGYDTTYGDDYDADYPGHGTHVAGTVSGNRTPVDGLASGNGMAPAARIYVQDLSHGSTSSVSVPSDLAQLLITPYAAGARLHTNSWGDLDNSYGPYAASTDRFAWEHRDFLPLFANGNSGPGSYTTGNPATAKNVISVGATYNGADAENMASFSSHGPTADGRIKPTVTAPGYAIVSADSDGSRESFNNGMEQMSGTSMATPAVAGAAAMVRQYFVHGYHPLGVPSPGSAFSPSAALVKAVLINSAQNMSGSATGGSIPATGQGWGRINLAKVLPFTGDGMRLSITDEASGLQTGGSWSGQVTVKGGAPLKITLVWTDYPAATGVSKALVNDLDLVVNSPDGTVLLGNAIINGESYAGGTPDRLNVEEQILVSYAVPGIYTISVNGYNTPFGPQTFALVANGGSGGTSQGEIGFDRRRYSTGSTLRIRVVDGDLNTGPATVEQLAIRVTSGAEPYGEAVILTESDPDSAVFYGNITLAPTPAIGDDGRLQVFNGDTLTAAYSDADDGTGRGVTVTTVATMDDRAPLLSGAAVESIGETGGTVVWNSDEPANSVLEYSDATGVKITVSDMQLTTRHSVTLTALREGGAYRLIAYSTDEAGNLSASDELSLNTLNIAPALSVTSSEGGMTYQASIIISGVCTDASGVNQVSLNGVPVSYRSSDGFYSIAVSLQLGGNSFTLQATDKVGNTTVSVITVTRLQPPDLFMQLLEGPQTAIQGGSITIADNVCNNGPGDAMAFSVGFYFSVDQDLSADDTYLGERVVASLAAGSCSGGTSRITVPAMIPGGGAYLLALADRGAALPDTSRSNNVRAGNQVLLPNPTLVAPAYLTVPATSSNGSFQVYFGTSSVGGVTYVLEMSMNGGAYAAIYSGTTSYATVMLTTGGSYSFRVKATKSCYGDSVYTTACCVVTFVCGTPAYLAVPAASSNGNFQVYFGASNVGGVTYVLEMSTSGGPYAVVYSGTTSYTTVTLTTGGTYAFRAKATKSGYADSAYTAAATCVVTFVCGIPAYLAVPASSSNGSLQVYFGASNVGGVTYVLEMSTNGGAYAVIYSGTTSYTTVTLTTGGTYAFRAKATKSGYADSAYTAAATCVVTFVCGIPAYLAVPASSSNGSFQVYFGASNVGGVAYVLEMSTNSGAYAVIYSGTTSYTTVTLTTSGSYSFRVKATKNGYGDSGYTTPASCVVSLTSGVLVRNVTRGTYHQSIDEAIATASTNDEIRIVVTYTGTSVTTAGPAMLVTVSGGWDSSHQAQTGISSVGTVTIVGPGIIADRLVL